MNFDSINKAESNFLFVILFPAAIIFIYTLYLLSYVFTEVDIAKLFPILDNKYYALLIIMFLSYVAGMFIHGIRYVGFVYYKILYDRKIKNAGTKLLFRFFRKGTTVEECLDRSREENCSYEWINEVKGMGASFTIKSMWRIAASIDKELQVYKFYFYSEIFQCCDTTFLVMCVFQIFLVIYLIIHHRNMVIINIILIFVFIIMRVISKMIGIAFANRFIHDIDIKRKISN